MEDQRTDRASGGVSYRKLQIAWSVTWIIAVALIPSVLPAVRMVSRHFGGWIVILWWWERLLVRLLPPPGCLTDSPSARFSSP